MIECRVQFDYLFVHDVAAATSESPVHVDSSEIEPGWIYEVRIEYVNQMFTSLIIRGAGEVDLGVTVALAIQRATMHVDSCFVESARHSVHGSEEHFEELFAGAFDLSTGSDDLIEGVDLQSFPVRVYALQNPSNRPDPTRTESR